MRGKPITETTFPHMLKNKKLYVQFQYLGDGFFKGFFTLEPWGSLESQIGRIPSAPTNSSTTDTLFLSISCIRVKNGSHKFQKYWKWVTHFLLHCIRNQQTLSLKSQTVNLLGFACPVGLCHNYSTQPLQVKANTNDMKMNGSGCVPIKAYLQKQGSRWIRPGSHSSLTLTVHDKSQFWMS